MFYMSNFSSDQKGSIPVVVGICTVLIAVIAGGAVDVTKTVYARSELQNALDAAVLAGKTSRLNPKQQIEIAENHFKTWQASSYEVESPKFYHQGDILVGEVRANIKNNFLNLTKFLSEDKKGIDEFNINLRSGATISELRDQVCFMAMHPSRKHTLELKDNVSFIAPDCNIYGNSDHPDDVVDPHRPTNFLTGKTVQAIGYGHHYLQNVTPPLAYAPELIPDPLAKKSIPNGGSCKFNNHKQNGNTLQSGTYCGGLTLIGGVKIAPGAEIYVKDGTLKIQNANIRGEGVTFLFNSGVDLDWSKSQLELTAPKTGKNAGIVFMGRGSADAVMDDVRVDVHGTIYLPNTVLEWTNKGNFKPKAKWTVWIIDGVTWNGEGTIYSNFKPEDSDIPYPSELNNVIPVQGIETVRLVY